MPKCSYCGLTYHNPRGLTLVLNSGDIKFLCSSKCRKNMLMKKRKVRWITKKTKSKEEIRQEILEESKQEEAGTSVNVEEKK
jgi:ribosomal protein L24E